MTERAKVANLAGQPSVPDSELGRTWFGSHDSYGAVRKNYGNTLN
jgi:hypothetical protein